MCSEVCLKGRQLRLWDPAEQVSTLEVLSLVLRCLSCLVSHLVLYLSQPGKTSLLNILAGRMSSNKKITVEADVRLDNAKVDPTDIDVRKHIAFVAQEDSLERTATPREAIKFSAKLRLPKTFTEEQLDALTARMLDELGLTHCADTIIGGGLLKGISGGEKKRTSVGVELVVKVRKWLRDSCFGAPINGQLTHCVLSNIPKPS